MGAFLLAVLASLVATLIGFLCAFFLKRHRMGTVSSSYRIYYYDFHVIHDVDKATLVVEKSFKIRARGNFEFIDDFPSISPQVAQFLPQEYKVFVEEYNNLREVFPNPVRAEPPPGFGVAPQNWYRINYEFTKGRQYTIATIAKYHSFQYLHIESRDAASLIAMFDVPLYFGIRGTRVDLTLMVHSPNRLHALPCLSRIEGEVRSGSLQLERKNPLRNEYLGHLRRADPSYTYAIHYRWLVPERQLLPADRKYVANRHDADAELPTKVTIEKGNNLEADIFLRGLLSCASKETIVVDNYLSTDFLDKVFHLVGRGQVIFVSRQPAPRIVERASELNKRRKNEGNGELRLIDADYAHGRLVIVDRRIAYLSGASFKDLGNKLDYIHKLGDDDLARRISDLVTLGYISQEPDSVSP
jgi:hypothetical protein